MTGPNAPVKTGADTATYTTDTASVSVQIHNRHVCLLVPFEFADGTTVTVCLKRTPGEARELAQRLVAHANYATPPACLYCGDTEDIFETRVVIDDRTDEYALQCGNCGGVWTE